MRGVGIFFFCFGFFLFFDILDFSQIEDGDYKSNWRCIFFTVFVFIF